MPEVVLLLKCIVSATALWFIIHIHLNVVKKKTEELRDASEWGIVSWLAALSGVLFVALFYVFVWWCFIKFFPWL